jgi:hypothetical protein
MSGKIAKRKRRRGYGQHTPLRVMDEVELAEGLADLENSPIGTRFLVIDGGGRLGPALARKVRSAEHEDGVE